MELTSEFVHLQRVKPDDIACREKRTLSHFYFLSDVDVLSKQLVLEDKSLRKLAKTTQTA